MKSGVNYTKFVLFFISSTLHIVQKLADFLYNIAHVIFITNISGEGTLLSMKKFCREKILTYFFNSNNI